MKIASLYDSDKNAAICVLEKTEDGTIRPIDSWQSGPEDRDYVTALERLSKGCRRAFINGKFVPGQEEAKHPIALMLVECDIDCVLIISEPNTKIQLEQWLFRAAKKGKFDSSAFDVWSIVEAELNRSDNNDYPLSMAFLQGVAEIQRHLFDDPRYPFRDVDFQLETEPSAIAARMIL